MAFPRRPSTLATASTWRREPLPGVTDPIAKASSYISSDAGEKPGLRARSDCTRLPGFTDDPDDWAGEVDTPCYIVDLISKVARVAVETVRIVDSVDTRKRRDD